MVPRNEKSSGTVYMQFSCLLAEESVWTGWSYCLGISRDMVDLAPLGLCG